MHFFILKIKYTKQKYFYKLFSLLVLTGCRSLIHHSALKKY